MSCKDNKRFRIDSIDDASASLLLGCDFAESLYEIPVGRSVGGSKLCKITRVNQNDVRLLFDTVSIRCLVAVSVRPNPTEPASHKMGQSLTNLIEPVGDCDFGAFKRKSSQFVPSCVPDGRFMHTLTCYIWGGDFG